ncbi:hypothetical protein WJ438_13355 [Streptomyces sp. GD-15H]
MVRQVAGIHGLIILTYWLWPKKAPAGEGRADRDGLAESEKSVRR